MSKKYIVRENLKQSLPGHYYQVLVALSYIFNALNQNEKFDIMLEKAGVGALDDIVIEYFSDNEHKQKTRRLFLQLKHANNDNEILNESDLKTKSGKFEIFKYFDDWYLFIKNQKDKSATECAYYTNRDFSNSIKNSKQIELDRGKYRFSNIFFQGGEDSLYEKIVSMIKKNSVMYNQDLVKNASSHTIAGNPTYKAAKEYYDGGRQSLSDKDAEKEINTFLKQHYVMMVGKQHVENLEKEVSKLVKDYFSKQEDSEAIFHALIVETWRWFRVLGKAHIWTEDTVKDQLAEFQTRFTELPQEIGRMLSELNQPLKTLNSKIAREDLVNQIDKAILGQDDLVVFEGGTGNGKSTLIAEYLLNRTILNPGKYLYFASPHAFLNDYENLLKLEKLAVFIVDGIEEYSIQLQEAINACQQKSRRVILFSRVSIPGGTSHSIPALSKTEIKDYLIQEGKLDHVITIGGKSLALKDIIELGSSGLFAGMQDPKNLKNICAIAVPETSSSHSPDLASPYIVNAQADFEPVPLNAERVMPLYTLNKVLTLNDFKGSKCVQYNGAENLDNFKINHPQTEKFGWLDLSSLNFSDSQEISVDLIEYLAKQITNHSDKERFRKGEFNLLLTDSNNCLNDWPPDLLQALVNLSQVIIFTEQSIATERNFILRIQKQKYYFEYQTSTLICLPSGSAQIKHPTEMSIQKTLKKDRVSEGSVIVAEAGGGKSTSLKVLYNEHIQSKSLVWSEQYHHLVLVPLSRLVNLKLANLLDVCVHFLDISDDVLKQAVTNDLAEGKVLFLLDAWDELNNIERQKLTPLLALFEQYRQVLIITRPTDRHNLFFNPVGIYELQRFTLEQVKECFKSFFKNKDNPKIAERFTKQAIQFLQKPDNQRALEVIGLPLQCYLLCEAWRPAFEATCQGVKVELPWERTSALSRVELYQLFVVSRLRKCFSDERIVMREGTLQSPEEICTLGNRYLVALQTAAYQQLIRGKSLKLGNDWFSKQISRLGLIDKGEFTHKTYAEYFLALYLVNRLITDGHEARALIEQYRYQSHYRLVFEFMAGIVSYGDPIIPTATSYLRDFWNALLQTPRDCIGLADNALIEACYAHSHKQALDRIFDSQALAGIDNFIKQSGDINKKEEELEDLPASFSSSYSSTSIDDEALTFEPPDQPYDYRDCVLNINGLPVAKYNAEEKRKALIWLHQRLISTPSFLVEAACINKMGELGVINRDFLVNLLERLDSTEHDARSNVQGCIINALIKLKIQLDDQHLSDNAFSKIIRHLVTRRLSKNEINWLGRQNYSEERLDFVLSYFAMASFTTQQAIVSVLASNKGESFLDKIYRLRNSKGKYRTLRHCFQHALLQAKRIDVKDYMASILAIDFTPDVVNGLLKPTRAVLEENSVTDIDRANWIDKVYRFALNAVNERERKEGISELVIEFIRLKPDADRMEELLAKLLSSDYDHGYWDTDVVFPCLPHVLPYFGKAFADYLVYKTTCDTKYLRYPLSSLLDLKQIEALPNTAARELMVKTCLSIYENKYLLKEEALRNELAIDSANPAYYVQGIEPDLVLSTILASSAASRMAFLQAYLTLNRYALTIDDDRVCVHMSGGIQAIAINSVQKEPLLKIQGQKLFFAEGVTSTVPPRSPSPVEFLFEYPGVLFNKKRKRSNSQVDLEIDVPTNKIAKTTLEANL
jgi:hypothetical protein